MSSFEEILDRQFTGYGFVVEGRNQLVEDLLSRYGTIIGQFVDGEQVPGVGQVTNTQNIARVIIGDGYISGTRVERKLLNYLTNSKAPTKTVILYGYENPIINTLPVQVEKFIGGSVVTLENPKDEILNEIEDKITQEGVNPEEFVHLLIDLDNGRLPYAPNNIEPTIELQLGNSDTQIQYVEGEPTSAIHWGQRKLMVGAVDMMSRIIQQDLSIGGNGNSWLIVYAGAAPGLWIPSFRSLFVKYDVEIHLWDEPIRFKIQDNGSTLRIAPEEFRDPNAANPGYFTDVVATNYANYNTDRRIIFMSDIRTINEESAVLQNMSEQRRWVEIMDPFASHLKMRLPYPKGRVGESYRYLDGQILVQAWNRPQSTETRLLVFDNQSEKSYNSLDYEKSCAWINQRERHLSYNVGALVDSILGVDSGYGRLIPVPSEGLCTCFDCTTEVRVVTEYINLMGVPFKKGSIEQFVTYIGNACRKDSSGRTLWIKEQSKIEPNNRVTVVILDKQRPDLEGNPLFDVYLGPIEDLRIEKYSNVIVGNDIALQQIRDLLATKPVNKPYILGNVANGITVMRNVINGERLPTIIDFHTDFDPKYDRSKDTGFNGRTQFNRFVQSMALIPSGNSTTVTDLNGLFMLYASRVL